MLRRARLVPVLFLLPVAVAAFVLSPMAAIGQEPRALGETLVQVWMDDPAQELPALAVGPVLPVAHEALPAPYVLVRSDDLGMDWLRAEGYRLQVLDADARGAVYCMADVQGLRSQPPLKGRVILQDSHRRLVRLEEGQDLAACGSGAWPLKGPIHLLPRPVSLAPATVTALPEVQDAIGLVDLPRVMAYIDELSGERPAVVGGLPYTITTRSTYSGESLERATQYMFEHLQRLGLEVSYHQWSPQYPPNVVAEKPGLTQPEDIYILGAHLDSTSFTPLVRAPGADDNASGSVGVLLAAEVLTPFQFDATLRFVLFTGEEQGLWGSAAYAQSVADENVVAMLNLDMIGWDDTGGPDMDLHAKSTVPGSLVLASTFYNVVTTYNLDLEPAIYANGTGASDHASFWDQGFPALLAIEDAWPSGAGDFNDYYHTINDRSVHLNQGYFREMIAASLATLAHLAPLRTGCHWADLDCDCQVDVQDLAIVIERWGVGRGAWNYHTIYDVVRDDVISVADVQRVASQWQWACTDGPPS